MLVEPLFEKLTALRLPGMREALQEQMTNTHYSELSFDERFSLLVDHEINLRADRRLKRLITNAKFRMQATIEDLNISSARGLNRQQILELARCDWIRNHLNVIITGATGVGKSFLAQALGFEACRKGFSTLYVRTSRLLYDIEMSRADGTYSKFLDKLARIDLLILDDWLRDVLKSSQSRDLLEVCDDRHQRSSTILVSQMPVTKWHARMKDPTLADAILDRMIHSAHRIQMEGESQRKIRGKEDAFDDDPSCK